MGENLAVSSVVIYNRIDGDASHSSEVSGRLSNSVVSLINQQGNTLKTYRIEDATNVPVFYINFESPSSASPTVSQAPSMSHSPSLNPSISQSPSSPSQLVHKVRVQLDGSNHLHMREVQVFDTNGVNRALNKLATQSSTTSGSWGSDPASKAVNGNLNDWSHTNNDLGMYHEWTKSSLIIYTIMSFLPSDPLSHSCSFSGAWWEVDLGEGVSVSRVVIYNRIDGDASLSSHVSGRLSNSVVSLLNYQGNTLKTYRIADATNIPVFDINFESPSSSFPTASPIEILSPSPTELSPTQSASQSPSSPRACSGILVEIKVLTDNYPGETTWSLSNQCGLVRGMSGGPYSSMNTFYSVSECLPAGEYKFTINDSWGDGICCGYGSGSYEILVNGLRTHTGEEFGESETKTFGVCASQSPTVSHAPSIRHSPSLKPSVLMSLISTDFSTVPSNSALTGSAFVSNGECVLTSNAQSQLGYLLFDSVALTPTLFNAQWDYRVFDGNGADGTSFNYGPMTSADGGEWGMAGAVLTVSFIEYQGERVELRYNGNIINSAAFTLTGNMYRRVVVNIDSVNFFTLSVGGSNVISTSLANTDYSLRDKTGWRFGFAGRTGALTNKHSIRNLVISRVDYGTLSPTVSQPSLSSSPSLNPSISQSPSSQHCFEDSTGDELRDGELYKAVDNYIGQGCDTNPNCEVRKDYGDIGSWCTSKITNMYGLFYDASSFNDPLDGWDLSSVTNTSAMFFRAYKFNHPLNGWIINNVTDMSFMFFSAIQFNQPLNGWNTGNVVSMKSTFNGALQFNQPINGWNVSSVVDMGLMFADSEFIYDTASHLFNQELNAWNVASVINMNFMFAGVNHFNQPLNAWNVSQVTDMVGMFSRAPNFNQPIDQWTVDNVTDLSYMFQKASKFNQNLNGWNISSVTRMIATFNKARDFNQPLNSWNVGNVTSMESMFDGAKDFNQPLNAWDVGKVNNMLWMFYDASSFDQSLNAWDVSNVTIMCNSIDEWPYGMFEQASSFNQPLNAWDVSKVTNFDAMFYSAESFNQDLCPWGNIATFPYDTVDGMFLNSGCTYRDSPNKARRGPFCASDCIVSAISSVSQLYSKLSFIEHIANENHQVSAQATALAAGSTKKKKNGLCPCAATGSNQCPAGQTTYRC